MAGARILKEAASVPENKRDGYVVRIESFKPKGKYNGGDARPDFKKFLDETLGQLEQLKIEDGGRVVKKKLLALADPDVQRLALKALQ